MKSGHRADKRMGMTGARRVIGALLGMLVLSFPHFSRADRGLVEWQEVAQAEDDVESIDAEVDVDGQAANELYDNDLSHASMPPEVDVEPLEEGESKDEDEDEWSEESEDDAEDWGESESESDPWAQPTNSYDTLLPEVTDASVVENAGSFPWYDPSKRSVRGVKIPDEPQPATPYDWSWEWSNKAPSNFNWEPIWQLVQAIVWISLACLMGWLILMWYRYLARSDMRRTEVEFERERQRHEIDSIEQLPFQMARPQTDLLSEARRHYQLGNFREAIVYLFSYQLVQLDRHQKIHLAKGKTNLQYLFELRSQPRLRDMLRTTTHMFEDVFFGHYDLQRVRFEQAWAQLEEFDRLAQQEAP